MNWERDDIIKLIEEYQKQRCLWDVQVPQYKDKQKKSDAWKVIDLFAVLLKVIPKRKMSALSSGTVDVFLQLLQMTKRMAEEIVPELLFQLGIKNLESLIAASNEVNASLTVFSKLCEIFVKKDLNRFSNGDNQSSTDQNCIAGIAKSEFGQSVDRSLKKQTITSTPASKPDTSTGPQSLQQQSSKDGSVKASNLLNDSLWKNALERIVTRFKDNSRLGDMFFCGLCNIHADQADIWGSHLQGKKHKEKCSALKKEDIRTHFCHSCRLFVLAETKLLNRILQSSEHKQLHELINVRKSNEPNKVDVKNNAPVLKTSEAKALSVPPVAERSAAVSNLDKPSSRETVTVLGKVISDQFVELMKEIKNLLSDHEEFTVLFCRPCEVIAYSMKDWNEHLNKSSHLKKMGNLSFKNVRALCTLCRFGMIASKPIVISYLSYHINHCHDFLVEDGFLDEYIDLKELLTSTTSKGLSKCRSNLEGSCESVDSQRGRRWPNRNRESGRVTPSSGRSTPKESSNFARSGSVSSNSSMTKPSSEQSVNVTSAEMDNDLSLFVDLLNAKEAQFKQNSSFKPFAALCLLCPHLKVSDQFSWFDHVGIHPSNDEQNEVECSECNTFVFGSVMKISEQFMQHPKHRQIDSIMSGL